MRTSSDQADQCSGFVVAKYVLDVHRAQAKPAGMPLDFWVCGHLLNRFLALSSFEF
jgi:hypothetical protein